MFDTNRVLKGTPMPIILLLLLVGSQLIVRARVNDRYIPLKEVCKQILNENDTSLRNGYESDFYSACSIVYSEP